MAQSRRQQEVEIFFITRKSLGSDRRPPNQHGFLNLRLPKFTISAHMIVKAEETRRILSQAGVKINICLLPNPEINI
jgi:hypothetical protein